MEFDASVLAAAAKNYGSTTTEPVQVSDSDSLFAGFDALTLAQAADSTKAAMPEEPQKPNGLLSSVKNEAARGFDAGKQSMYFAAVAAGHDDSIADLARLNREMRQRTMSPELEAFNAAEGFGATLKEVAKNPIDITAPLIGQSIATMIPQAPIIGGSAAAGAGIGAAAGAVAGGAGAAPGAAAGAGWGAAVGVGAASGLAEATGEFMTALEERGVDVTDEAQLRAAFANPELRNEAKQRAIAKGVPVAIFDMVAGKLAGRALAPAASVLGRAGQVAGRIGEQAAMGAAGEATGELAAQGKLSAPDIVAEALGEIGAGGAEVAVQQTLGGIARGPEAKLQAEVEAARVKAEADRRTIEEKLPERSAEGQQFYRELTTKTQLDPQVAYASTVVLDTVAETSSRRAGMTREEWFVKNPLRVAGVEELLTPTQQAAKGSYEFYAEAGEHLISLTKIADASTIQHELAHFFRRTALTETQTTRLHKWAGVLEDGTWTPEAEEKFAQGWERYFQEGKAPTTQLADIFVQFKAWLARIYNGLLGIDMSPEFVQTVEELLGATPAKQYGLQLGQETQRIARAGKGFGKSAKGWTAAELTAEPAVVSTEPAAAVAVGQETISPTKFRPSKLTETLEPPEGLEPSRNAAEAVGGTPLSATEGPLYQVDAYHGSGAFFDKVDHSYMGTGEGNQAFGWGTYTTQEEATGRHYAKISARWSTTREFKALLQQLGLKDLPESYSKSKAEVLTFIEGQRGLWERHLAERGSLSPKAAERLAKLTQLRDAVVAASEETYFNKPQRVLYRVTAFKGKTKEKDYELLDWDEDASFDQVEWIDEALVAKGELTPGQFTQTVRQWAVEQDAKDAKGNEFFDMPTGQDVYDALTSHFGSDKAASQFLASIGIRGIEHLGNFGRGPYKNFVIFDENDLTIEGFEFFQTLLPANASPEAKKVEAAFLKSREAFEKSRQLNTKSLAAKMATALVDTSFNANRQLRKTFGRAGATAMTLRDLTRGYVPAANQIVKQRVAPLYKGLTKEQHNLLDAAIRSRTYIDIFKRQPNYTATEQTTALQHQAFLDEAAKTAEWAEVGARVEGYFRLMREESIDKLLAAELMTQAGYDQLKDLAYEPTQYLDKLDPEVGTFVGGAKVQVSDSGIKRIREGSKEAVELDSQKLIEQVIVRTQARLFKNRANRALAEAARTGKAPDLVREASIVQKGQKVITDKYGNPRVHKTPHGYSEVYFYEKGQRKTLWVVDSLAKEWVGGIQWITPEMASTLGWASGTKVLKFFATGANPEFAIANLFRDMALAIVATHEYSSFVPKALGELAVDYMKTAGDVFFRHARPDGRVAQYIAEGGGMEFLSQQGRVEGVGMGAIKALQSALSFIGESTELWTRLAIRERAIRNGKSPIEATWEARNYLDFSKGGAFTKAADSVVPYLNASMQGTRSMFRAMFDDPKRFSWQMAQLMSLSVGLMLMNRSADKEAWDEIPAGEKERNFIILLPFAFRDKQGNKRTAYFKVAKDQGQRFFSTMAEAGMAKFLGEKVDGEQVAQALKDAAPVVPLATGTLPPLVAATLGYMANKDFWRMDDVWKGPRVEAEQEFTGETNPALVAVGEATGLSPTRLGKSLEAVFTGQHPLTDAAAWGLREIMSELPEAAQEEISKEFLRRLPGVRKFLGFTSPFAGFRNEADAIRVESNTTRFIGDRKFEALTDQFVNGGQKAEDRKRVMDFIMKQQPVERKRLLQKFKEERLLFGVPDRAWWGALKNMPSPEARAQMFIDRWSDSDETEKRELMRLARRVPGIMSSRFMRQVNALKRGSQKAPLT